MPRVSIADFEAALAGHRGSPHRANGPDRIQAAVCVPLRETAAGLATWCIKRPDRMRDHSREIAFPGGKPEPGDADLAATALRETEEEIGIPRQQLRLLGALTPVPTATSRFTLNPFVVEVIGPANPRPDAAEVDELIEVGFEAFFAGDIAFEAIDLGAYYSPIFTFAAGAMYGATAHVLLEALQIYARADGLSLPDPVFTDRIPWQ